MFQSPSEVAFNIFGFPIYIYGIILAFSIFIGFYAAYFLFKKFYEKEDASKIFDFAPLAIILGIIGARLYYCFVNFSYYSSHSNEIFYIRQGGLSIHGMIFAGVLTVLFLAKKYKISFAKLMDVFLCAAPLAQAIGRWGNFFNAEAFGTPTDLPWKLFIPVSHRPLEYINFEYFHPTFLYESILDLLIFVILVSFFKKCSKTPGVIACLYLILYSSARIFVEHFRIDSVLYIGSIPVAQIVSVLLILIAFVILVYLKIKDNFSL